MARLYAVLRPAAVGVCAMFLLAGCRGSDLTGQLGSESDDLVNLSEDDVFGVLGVVVEADTLDDEAVPAAEDDEPYFGEQEALYEQGVLEAVEISESSIEAETETEFGIEPAAIGRLAGRFWNDRPDSTSDESGGIFRGRWFAADDEPRGVLRGAYHPIALENLPEGLTGGGWLHGRYIDDEGRFRGWLHGRYGHADGGRTLFFGHWLDRSLRLVGVLKGHWTDDPEVNGGWFAGRWAAFNICHEADALPDLEAEDLAAGLTDVQFAELDALEDPGEPEALPVLGETTLEDEVELPASDEPPCIEIDGLLRGWHWPHLLDDAARADGGYFRGRWRAADREPVEILFGRYIPRPPSSSGDDPSNEDLADDLDRARLAGGLVSTDAEGAVAVEPQVPQPRPRVGRAAGRFYGKYVDRTGDLRGYLRGVYGTGPHGLGVFRGRYYNPVGELMGIIRGRWDNALEQASGPFFGISVGVNLDGGEEPPQEQ